MSISAVALLAVALGMDAFSMAVGLGVTGVRRKHIFLISGVVCLFHVLMPLAGWTLGAITGNAVGRFAGVFGAAVLIIMGLAGILEVVEANRIQAGPGHGFGFGSFRPRLHVARGLLGLLVLAGSVSLDALSVGFGLGTFGAELWLTLIMFGTAAGLMTAGGFLFGRNLGQWLGNKGDLAGALILLLIGIKMLFT